MSKPLAPNLYIKYADGHEAEIPLRDIRLRRENLAPDGPDVEDYTIHAKPTDWLAMAGGLALALNQLDRRGVSLKSFLEQ